MLSSRAICCALSGVVQRSGSDTRAVSSAILFESKTGETTLVISLKVFSISFRESKSSVIFILRYFAKTVRNER